MCKLLIERPKKKKKQIAQIFNHHKLAKHMQWSFGEIDIYKQEFLSLYQSIQKM